MKHVVSLMLALCACLTSSQAQTLPRNPTFPRLPRKPAITQTAAPVRDASGLPATPATEASNIVRTTCPPRTSGAACGYVKVPLDREHPKRGLIPIFFALYKHSNPGPAESAILVNFGGPGFATSISAGFSQFIYGANLDVHDLLIVDDRGRGFSAAIDCRELQHGTTDFARSEADCAAQLGDAVTLYGSGDIAQDMDAVRAALGYELVDYHGGSYGGADVTAYATRFGQHLRSIVLDAPYGTPILDPFAVERDRTHSDSRMVRLDCVRSPTCSADHPSPADDFEQLVDSIQQQPVEGDAHDANGNLVHVHLGETALLNFIVNNVSGNYTNIGELLAAGSALKHGDPSPLLRLGAEGSFTLVGDSGDPTVFSAAAFYATGCVDAYEHFDWEDPVFERKQQYADAVFDLPRDYFAPFSKPAATGLLFSHLGKQCLWWEKPRPSSPVALPDAIYPHVPTLVLTGDIDNTVPLEATTKVAALFPDSTSVTVAEAGHETVNWSQCARNLATEFIEHLQLSDTSCANTPEVVWPAVGRFPLLAKDARPAEVIPNGNNQIGLGERKVVTVAVAAATDALQRSIIGSGVGVGLRAGTFSTNYGATWTSTLTGSAFATDVTVSGTVTWAADNSFGADLTVGGPGTAGGTLHVAGFWQATAPVGNFSVTGTLGGKQVAVLVPEA